MEEHFSNFLGFLRTLAGDPDSRLTAILGGILFALTAIAIRRKKPTDTTVTVKVPHGESVCVSVGREAEKKQSPQFIHALTPMQSLSWGNLIEPVGQMNIPRVDHVHAPQVMEKTINVNVPQPVQDTPPSPYPPIFRHSYRCGDVEESIETPSYEQFAAHLQRVIGEKEKQASLPPDPCGYPMPNGYSVSCDGYSGQNGDCKNREIRQ